jgi:hypothetical protein
MATQSSVPRPSRSACSRASPTTWPATRPGWSSSPRSLCSPTSTTPLRAQRCACTRGSGSPTSSRACRSDLSTGGLGLRVDAEHAWEQRNAIVAESENALDDLALLAAGLKQACGAKWKRYRKLRSGGQVREPVRGGRDLRRGARRGGARARGHRCRGRGRRQARQPRLWRYARKLPGRLGGSLGRAEGALQQGELGAGIAAARRSYPRPWCASQPAIANRDELFKLLDVQGAKRLRT